MLITGNMAAYYKSI